MLAKRGAICLAIYRPDSILLRRQIRSLQLQTEENWTCIVGLDGSDPEALQEVKSAIGDDARFNIHEFDIRVGFYRNFERLLRLVPNDAEWIALSDQDDYWYPAKLEKLVRHLSVFSLASGQALVVQSEKSGQGQSSVGITARSISSVGELMFDNKVSGALSVFRSGLLHKALPFPAETDVAYHDHWIGVCAALQDGIHFTSEVLQEYVQHDGNAIGEERSRSLLPRLLSLRRQTSGVVSAVTYVVRHRWRWRVIMSRAALARFDYLRDKDSQIMRAFAVDRLNLALVQTSARALIRGDSSRLRVASAIVASIISPMTRKDRDD